MDIGEVARRSGFRASALRYYEREGLIRSLGRKGLRRQYAPEVVERLALIALGRTAGLTLEEIRGMLTGGWRPRVDRGLLAARAEALDAQIRRMTALRDGLRHAAACRAPDHLECPTFRRLLGIAVARRGGAG
ncbi:MAG TPA: helix-turn-helix domain-containing protein [Gemmatimonadales bacterium]|nr:helix-turn-helix domain-containing protein [Gemmatimonadales bacterium]